MKVLKALLEERDKKQGELDQLAKSVEERVSTWKAQPEDTRGEELTLTDEEETRSQTLMTELDELDRRVDEEKDKEQRRRKIAEARELVSSAETRAEVVSEPVVYGVQDDVESPNSYVGDLCRRALLPFTGTDGGATQRLAQWAHQVEVNLAEGNKFGRQAEKQLRELNREYGPVEAPKRMAELRDRGRVALDGKTADLEMRSGIGTGGGATASASGGGGAAFVTPVFDVDSYAPYRELGRPFIDQCYKQPLPDYGMEVYIPAVTGGAEASKQTEGGQVPEKVVTAGYLSGGLIDISGEQIVTQILLDRAGPNFAFDKMVFDQIERNYAKNVNLVTLEKALEKAIEQSWSGNGGEFVLTEKGKAGGFLGQIAKAKATMRTASGTILDPSHLFLIQNRWDYITAFSDENGRPLVTADKNGPFNAVAAGSADGREGIEGATGWEMSGLPIFQDGSIPLIGTTTQDQAIVGDLREVWVYEGPPVTRVIPQTLAEKLQVLLQRYSYWTAIVRYEKAITFITGTAMKAPVYTH
jgi:hypothetical protein